MTFTLHPHQIRGVDDMRAAFARGVRRVLYVSPTGSGKTVIAAHVIASTIARGNRVLFGAGRTELIEQTANKLRDAGVDRIRVIQADRDEGDENAPVIVGSVQTLSATRWAGRVPKAQLIMLDECHHGPSFQYRSIVAEQPDALLIGLTATPERSDGKPLGDMFDEIVLGPTVAELTDGGFLVPLKIWSGPSTLKPGELAITPLEAYQRFAIGERAAVFCRDRKHAAAELEVFRAAGISSEMVIGTMSAARRKAVLAAWRTGDVHVVTSVGVLTEGFDLPELGCAILARRFGHAGQFLQAVGRILRTAPSKSQAFLADLAGSVHEHGPPSLPREYSLTGKAIRRSRRDAIRQCPTCGSVFLAGPARCPECLNALPVSPMAAPRSIGVGLEEYTVPKPKRDWESRLQAKHEGHCRKCGRWFPRGTPIVWVKGKGSWHQRCQLPPLSVGVSP